MRLTYNDEQRQLRAELSRYFRTHLEGEFSDLRWEDHGPRYRAWIRRLGSDGWLGLGWPVEYGGQGRPAMDQFIFYDEAQRAGAPIPMISLNTVGPTLMDYGTAEQKALFLPAILRGEIDFAIGYTEPEAGTDLASLRTKAVRDGDEYVVNGTKVFTSRGAASDYIWLAARTEPATRDHRGISVLIVDTSAPGFTAAPIRTLASYDTYITTYTDVRVPRDRLVGVEGEGWRLMQTQLNHERIAMAGFGGLAIRLHEEVLAWAGATERDGRPVIHIPWVQRNLARSHALVEAMHLLNCRVAWEVGRDEVAPADASAVKVFGTETVLEVYRLLMEVVGAESLLADGARGQSPWGALEFAYRRAVINTFGGGTNEVQREIVARAGLGMPRVARRLDRVVRA
ncbi:acyl-CoA dehydrogenase family protein [Asanoa iriomotensis]|uniref:Acyl-CoA dehydrogenase n=1 Tax=Asanoa iriomotensis TaxID=234613 RepID=A0ABQ4C407_9ACTN|nr:acyl-CoA dehydrogenase family protein [Asanoa iriomotensis]GIF57499.1 acyl-CoA dehydrogenase [Asanoa iriomotensis]